MQENISAQIEALKTTGTAQLSELYRQYFDDKAAPGNRTFLIRQIAYQIQEKALGGLSTSAKDRIRELIQAYDPINKLAIKTSSPDRTGGRDNRLPTPGSFITKKYKGKRIDVKVLEQGFEYQSTIYSNLSAVAEAVTGAHWNGFAFFGVKNRGRN